MHQVGLSTHSLFSRNLIVTCGLLQGQLLSQLWLTWIWESPRLWVLDDAWLRGHRQEVVVLRTHRGFSFWKILSPVHADRNPVSSGPSGGVTAGVKGEEKVGSSFLYVTAEEGGVHFHWSPQRKGLVWKSVGFRWFFWLWCRQLPVCLCGVVMGSLTLGPHTGTPCQMGDGNRLEIKGTINVMCLNHPETIPTPPQSVEKLSSCKPIPGVKQVVVGWCVVSHFLGVILSLFFFRTQNMFSVLFQPFKFHANFYHS